MAGVLIEQLKLVSVRADDYLAKRSNPRGSFTSNIPLEMRLDDGRLLYVSAVNVSETGIGFLTREKLKPGDQIELRLADENSAEFEPYEVQRATQSVSGFKIGAIAR